ncbi:outer membrane efflux protein [Fulvivirga imtechensis AK7]|uniref:Outer membrane efflux protein n=1 Tax=Fulvivirga imtechensis AK7 TaxID=1237149 RepID=L8JXS8_9BACT|nr:TolC family protein [Fulvivirga imtechensis]ELR73856.1 outer membrane efflux protein [Fulvivirga imtechensis AK7]
MYRSLLIIAFSFLYISVSAQEELSLSDAIKTGLKRNYDIRIEEKNIEIAENNNSWGEAGKYPTLTLNLNQNNSLTDNIKTASPFQLQDQTISNSLNPGINLNWTLFNGFKINISKYRLEQLQAQSKGNAEIVISNTIQSIILGYYKAVLEKERLEEFEKQLRLSSDKYEYTRVKSELGSAVSSDLLLEEANYLTDSTNYINQQLTLRNAVRDLNVLLAEPEVDKQYVLTTELAVEVEEYELANLMTKLNTNNVDLKKQYIAQRLLDYDVRLSRAERYPQVALNAGYSHNRSRVDLSNATFPSQDGSSSPGPPDPLNAVTDNYFANFTVSFTLFNGGRINRAIQNTIIQEDIENIRTDKLKNSLYGDLAKAHDEYQIRARLYRISDRRKTSTQTNLNISEEKFKTGTINSFDYRTVQNNHLSAAIQELQSLYNVIDAKVTLMRLTGGIIETYVVE